MIDYFAPLLTRVKNEFPSFDLKRLQAAYDFARIAHSNQLRFSGEPYVTHLVAVAEILLDYSPDEDMLVAALLHDVSEDTEYTLENISSRFGAAVATLVQGLEKLAKVRATGEHQEVENLRKMFVYMAADLRIIIIKLCDRLHNMRTLDFVRLDKQQRISRETMQIYVPIAARLGIYELKGELEDLCFYHLEPESYLELKKQLDEYVEQMGMTIDDIKRGLYQYLAELGYRGVRVEGRLKSLYSIHRKLKRKGRLTFDELYDVFAIRVIVPDGDKEGYESTGDLYAILGAIHSKWTPLPHRFKDYVAVPKPNGYQSLHTTVIGLGPKSRHQPTEIQIRTVKMHEQSLHGIASHWFYNQSEGDSTRMTAERIKKNDRLNRQLEWVEALNSLQREIANNSELIDTLHHDFLSDRIFVLTPGGDVKDLPAGATPIDFAFSVHSELGQSCAMAKVNSRIVPLDYQLNNGDVVEIVTRPNAHPRQYWLSFVKTNFAKARIKNWLKQNDDPVKSLREGREILNSHLQELAQPPLDNELSILKNYNSKKLTLRQREDVIRDLGRGVLMPNMVIKQIFSEDELLRSRKRIESARLKKKTLETGDKPSDLDPKKIVVDGLMNVPIRFADCCKPNFPTPIVGYVTINKGLSVHSKQCKLLGQLKADKFVNVYWQGVKPEMYKVNLELVMEDRVGLLRDISDTVSAMGVNITGLSLRSEDAFNIFREFEVELDSYDTLVELIRRLKEVPSVKSVKKVA